MLLLLLQPLIRVVGGANSGNRITPFVDERAGFCRCGVCFARSGPPPYGPLDGGAITGRTDKQSPRPTKARSLMVWAWGASATDGRG